MTEHERASHRLPERNAKGACQVCASVIASPPAEALELDRAQVPPYPEDTVVIPEGIESGDVKLQDGGVPCASQNAG